MSSPPSPQGDADFGWQQLSSSLLTAQEIESFNTRKGLSTAAREFNKSNGISASVAIRERGSTLTAYGYCSRHVNCKKAWRHFGRKNAAGAEEHVVEQKGYHEKKERITRGHTVESRDKARQYASLPPVAAAAKMLADGVAGDELPSRELLARQRQSFMAKTKGNEQQGGGLDLGSWLFFCDSRANEEDAPAFKFVAVPADREKGLFVWVCENFLQQSAQLKSKPLHPLDDPSGSAVVDVTYKLTRSDWGLFRLATAVKVLDESLWRTTTLTLAFAWVPKESSEAMTAALKTAADWYRGRGLDLQAWIGHIFFDDVDAGRSAAKVVFPKAWFWRDLRHQLAAIKKHAGDPASKGFLAFAVQFAALQGWNRHLFSMLIDTAMLHLISSAQLPLLEYMRGHIVFRGEGGLWDAEWRVATRLLTWKSELEGRREHSSGLSPATVGQAAESFWQGLKRTLPSGMHRLSMEASTGQLQKQVEASQRLVGANKVTFPRVNGVSSRLVVGPSSTTERFAFDDNDQVKVPCVSDFLAHAPDNFKVAEFKDFEHGDAIRAYTLPFRAAEMKIDDVVHGAMVGLMTADSTGAVKAALEKVGAWVVEDGARDGRASLSATKHFLFSICGVIVLRGGGDSGFDGVCRCTCSQYARCGQCSHELFVRALEGDPVTGKHIVTLDTLTKKNAPDTSQPLKVAFEAFRRAKTPSPPSASAWVTMEEIARRAAKRAAQKMQKQKDWSLDDAFGSPQRRTKSAVAAPSAADLRGNKVIEIAGKLQKDDFKSRFQGLSAALSEHITLQEAQSAGVAKVVVNIAKDVTISAPMRALAEKLKLIWVAQRRLPMEPGNRAAQPAAAAALAESKKAAPQSSPSSSASPSSSSSSSSSASSASSSSSAAPNASAAASRKRQTSSKTTGDAAAEKKRRK
jgi:hypothetical protein